ncbi:hypothetical protein GCM10009733_021050 [Nonomuraea maheshkhaliensis]|uniref:Type II toxin-antitoxin system Phd/YefM family antitoxin n=1 Tax=Nonomuraea maheshkhaliensis TaxID=419590 RepID=A0ABN2F2J4_9ACTN
MTDFQEPQPLLVDGPLADVVRHIAAAGFLAQSVQVVTHDGVPAALISMEQVDLLNRLVAQEAAAGQRPMTDTELADFLTQPPETPETEAVSPAHHPPHL